MTIAVDNTSNGTDANSSELTVAHTVSSVEGGGILIVTIQVTDSSEEDRIIISVTHNGEDLTYLFGSDSDDGIEERTEIWFRQNPTTGGTPNIVVTPTDTCTDLTLGAISLTGVDGDLHKIIDSYSETNQNASITINDNDETGQSFTGNGDKLHAAKFFIKTSSASATGNAYVKIYEHSGTYGTSSVGTGAALATSDAFDVSTLSDTVFSLETFIFSGVNKITLTDGVYYVATIMYSNATYSVQVGTDTTSPTHSGNGVYYVFSTTTWTYYPTDRCFYIYTSPSQSATGATGPPTLSITTEGTSSYAIDSLAIAESDGAKITAVHTAGGSPIHKTDVGGDTHGSQFVDAGGAGPQTMNWNDTDQDRSWVLSAVSVQEAADDARVPRAGVVNFQIPGIV